MNAWRTCESLRNPQNRCIFSQIVAHYANFARLLACYLICDKRYDSATKRQRSVANMQSIGCAMSMAAKTSLHGVRAPAGPCGSALALLQLEGEDIEQAIDSIRERLEQRLLLQRRDIEMEAQEIDQLCPT
jgi:hypothetical protein